MSNLYKKFGFVSSPIGMTDVQLCSGFKPPEKLLLCFPHVFFNKLRCGSFYTYCMVAVR